MDNPETMEFEGKTYTRVDLRAGDVIPEGAMIRTLRGTLTPTSCTGATLVHCSTYYIEKPQPEEPTYTLELTCTEAHELWMGFDEGRWLELSEKLDQVRQAAQDDVDLRDKTLATKRKIKELEAQLAELKEELKGQ